MNEKINLQNFVDNLVDNFVPIDYTRYNELSEAFRSVIYKPELFDFFSIKYRYIYLYNKDNGWHQYIGWFGD